MSGYFVLVMQLNTIIFLLLNYIIVWRRNVFMGFILPGKLTVRLVMKKLQPKV